MLQPPERFVDRLYGRFIGQWPVVEDVSLFPNHRDVVVAGFRG
jgi:hypothetical protein